jgi:hypothetical protein
VSARARVEPPDVERGGGCQMPKNQRIARHGAVQLARTAMFWRLG